MRAALAWLTATDGHADQALRLAGSLGLYWHMGRHLEGRDTLRRVMSLTGGSPPARARAMQAVSLVERPRACIVHPSEQCAAAALNSLDIFESVGDRPRAAFSRLLLAVEGVGANPRHDAAALLAEADREFAALGDDWGQAVAAFVQMETLTKRGDEAGAQQYADKAITLFRRLGGGWGLSAVLYHRGWGLARFGRHAEAVSVYQEAIDVANDAGVYNTVQWATADLGLTLLALGRVDEASDVLRPRRSSLRPGRRRRGEGRSPPTAPPSSPSRTATTPAPGPCSTAPAAPSNASGCRSPPDRHSPE